MVDMGFLERLWSGPQDVSPEPRATQARILRHGIEIFGRRGFGGASVREIAAAAGVTPPLIGYHFGNKEGLFCRCVETVTDSFVGEVDAMLDERPPLAELARSYARINVRFAREYPDAVRMFLLATYGPEDGQPSCAQMVQHWVRIWKRISESFESAIADGSLVPRPGSTVPSLVKHFFNVVHLELYNRHERDRFAEQLAELILPDLEAEEAAEEIVEQFFGGAGRLVSDPTEADS